MKIALINENSQAAKNALIEATLRKVVEPMGHEVVNYGMYAADDAAQHVVLDLVERGVEGEFAFPEDIDLEDHHEHAQRELDDRQCIETHVSDSHSRRRCDR